MLIALLSCTSGTESVEGEALASSKSNENACDCIEVMRSTLDGINTWEEFLNVETTLINAAPECEEIMIQSSADEFIMMNCNEVAVELEVALNEKMASFYNEMANEAIDATLDEDPAEEAISDSVSSEE